VNHQATHHEEVEAAVRRALASGMAESLDEVIRFVGSADPHLVRDILENLQLDTIEGVRDFKLRSTRARRLSALLPLELPAPDPMRCQWWFTLDSVVELAKKAWEYSGDGTVAVIGAPTVGFFLSHWLQGATVILDADPDVIKSLKLPHRADKEIYDVADPIPTRFRRKYAVALVDPPWYPSLIELFICRAADLVRLGGYILCVVPSRHTRPGLIEERTSLVNALLERHFYFVALESECLTYCVPEFERLALGELEGFSGRQWRRGDLLILRTGASSLSDGCTSVSSRKPLIYARDARVARFFLDERSVDASLENWIEQVQEFSGTVSYRGLSLERIAIWGTNKRAASVRDIEPARTILELWAAGYDRETVASKLSQTGMSDAKERVEQFDAVLKIWSEPSIPKLRRTPERLERLRVSVLSSFASEPTMRVYPHEADGFRLEFQRDRDRILWSNSLRRLSNKTQLLPVSSDDHPRRRLTHSIEVMQLASTIAASFGLDPELTQAGALAHDIGHAPFGHAGETALDHVMKEIDDRLGGFNHYEHGADVVCWLEDMYLSPGAGGFPGLNLTPETVECILKHGFHRTEGYLAQSRLVAASKHRVDDSSCHLEGQAVRIADKISYLISDLEDGLRMGAITYEDLMSCRLFERAPIDLAPAPGELLYERFVSQRRSILKVLMEDILRTTDERLSRLKSLEDVRATRAYTVDFSKTVKEDVNEIWMRLQVGRLHNHPKVIAESVRASQVVRDLFFVYCARPELTSSSFRQHHPPLDTEYMQWYLRQVGPEVGVPKRLLAGYYSEHMLRGEFKSQGDNWLIPTKNIVLAKDYVASLTDQRAIEEHRRRCRQLD